jgi:hypothetical protein
VPTSSCEKKEDRFWSSRDRRLHDPGGDGASPVTGGSGMSRNPNNAGIETVLPFLAVGDETSCLVD